MIATEAGLTHGLVNSTLPLLNEMKNAGLPIRQHYFWPLICSVEHNQIFDILRKMQDEFNIPPSAETIREYVIPNLKEKNWDKIITLLRDAGVSHGTAAAAACYTALSNNQIKEAANIMESYNSIYNHQVMRQPLIQAFAKTLSYNDFVRCTRQLYESALKRTAQQANAASSAATATTSTAEKSEQANEESDVAPESEDTVAKTSKGTIDIVGDILGDVTSYFRADRVKMLEKLLPKFVQQGFTISNQRAASLSEKLGSDMTPAISEMLGKLSSGELELAPLKNAAKKRGIETLTVEGEYFEISSKNCR